MNPSDVYVFNKVAKSLSFTIAAREVGASRSAVSKRIARLEKSLGVMLLNRNTRSVSLTEAGRTLFRNTSEVDLIIERAVNNIRTAEQELVGTVRLSLPSGFGTSLLPSIITRFRKTWPEVKIDVHIDDHDIDLIAGGYDLAIVVSGKLDDSSLVCRRLGSTDKILVASPGYLGRFGIPSRLKDLEKHFFLGFHKNLTNGPPWRFESRDNVFEVSCSHSVMTDNIQALVDAACLDNGMIYVPRVFVRSQLEQGLLTQVLTDSYIPEPVGIFALYPHRNAAAKVKVLVEFVDQEMKSLGMIEPESMHDPGHLVLPECE